MTVRFLKKIDLGEGVGAYEFTLEEHKGTKSELYERGTSIYESLLRSRGLSSESPAASQPASEK